jgi:two-component system NtrC family sensor kinase
MLQIVPRARNLVLDTMDQAVLILDTGGLLVDYNPAAADMLGIVEKDISRSVEDIPVLKDIIGQQETRRLASFEAELDILGQYRHLDVFLRPIGQAPRQLIGQVLIISDVTLRMMLMEDRMKLAAETQRANDELKETQMRLIHREKLASIGQLSAGLAHEMKNPVSFLQSNLRFLRKKLENLGARYAADLPDGEIREIREVLDDSEDGFSRILTVVDNLLLFSRPGTSKEKEYYDLNRGIDTTLQITRSLLESGVAITVQKEYGELPPTRAFPGEINQVILNLVTNAIHAVQNLLGDDAIIAIRTWHADGEVHCRIANNGPPIEEGHLGTDFRAVFLHQGGRPGHRPGPINRQGHHRRTAWG